MGLVAFIMAYALFAFIFYILQVIAYWKIFTKAGEEGWKSIIPIYNGYVQYRLTWDVQYFWVALGLAVGGGILNSFGGIVGVIGSLALLGTALMNVVALGVCLWSRDRIYDWFIFPESAFYADSWFW